MTRLPVQHLATASALYGLSAATAKALALLTVPYLTRALGADEYGLADLATSTAALLTLVAQFAGDIPSARMAGADGRPEMRRGVFASYVWGTLAVSGLLAIILLPAASFIATHVWGAASEASGLAALTLLLVPLSAAQAALTQVQRLRSRPGVYALLSTVDLLAQLLLAVLFVWLGAGPTGVVLGFVIGSVVGLVAAAVAAADVFRAKPSLGVGLAIIGRGLPFLPYLGAFVAADWIVRTIVANAAGSAEVGAFGVAVRVASLMTLVGTAFAMAWGPYGLALARSRETASIFGAAIWLYGGCALGLAAILASAGPELTEFIAGPGFTDAAIMLPGLAVAGALAGIEYILVVAAGVTDAGRRVALAALSGAAVQIAAAAVLIGTVGVEAIGPAAVLGRLISFVVLAHALRAFLQIPRRMIFAGTAIGVAVVVFTQTAVAEESVVGRLIILTIGFVGCAWFVLRAISASGRPQAT